MNSPVPTAVSTEANTLNLGELTADFFQPLVNDTFLMHCGGEAPEPLELIYATANSKHARPGSRVPFSLIFRAGSREFYRPQGVFLLEHSNLGRVELFLVPIGPDDAGMLFQAVFN